MVFFPRIAQFCYHLQWAYRESFKNPKPEKTIQIDRTQYLGRSFENILREFPGASVQSDHLGRRDPITADVRTADGMMVMIFKNFICTNIHYYPR